MQGRDEVVRRVRDMEMHGLHNVGVVSVVGAEDETRCGEIINGGWGVKVHGF